MECVVTGGAGFIGSNLVDRLLRQGDRVTVIDDLSTGKTANLEPAGAAGATLRVADVADFAATAAIIEEVRPDWIFHLAAQVDVRISVQDPARDARTNLLGTLSVLEAARRFGVRRVVNTSTGGGLYGDAELLPTPERPPIQPLAPYGQGKLAAEGYCELYRRLHGVSTVVVALRQCLRTAPGRPRRGGRGGDLLRPRDRRHGANDLRRRPADPRLGRGVRRGRRQPAGGRVDADRAGQHRPRP